jgi:catechol 2,3-dioxygenase
VASSRLPDATHVGRVILRIADLDRSLEFYRDLIGLRVLDQHESAPRWAHLGPQTGNAVLLELREKRGVRPIPRQQLLGLYHFALLLPDRASLGRFVRHLADHGARAGAADHLFSEALYLEDPDGMTVEVYRDRPRNEWPSRRGELISASDPIDFDALLEASGDERWSGVPAGSVNGHVHFYVDDIPKADAFYHRALGFEPTITTWPGALFVSAGGYHHHVGLNTWSAGAPIATHADAGLVEWELVVPGAEAVADTTSRLRGAGYDVTSIDDGARASDPWNIVVHIRPAA